MNSNARIKKGEEITTIYLTAVLIAVVAARLLLSLLPSYKIDMGGYKAWSLHLAGKGFSGLYETFHIVYAPAYMYLLWFTGEIASILHLGDTALEFMIKIWAVLSDIAGGYLIFLIGRRYKRQRTGLLLGAVYALNPGVFFNSSVWGQFDSIPATLLLGVIYCFTLNKKVSAAILFAIAVLTKPQSALLAPLVLILFFRGFSFGKIEHRRKLLYAITGCAGIYIFTVYPFYRATPFYSEAQQALPNFAAPIYQAADFFYWIIELYLRSVKDYPYATANAFNIWTILGGQTVNDSLPFLGLNYNTWGTVFFLALPVPLSVILAVKRKGSELASYFSAFLMFFGAFMFMTRMHERYLLPAIIFITVSILWDSRLWLPMGILSLCVLGNHWYVYYMTNRGQTWLRNYDTFAVITAVITLAVMMYTIYYALKLTIINGKPVKGSKHPAA